MVLNRDEYMFYYAGVTSSGHKIYTLMEFIGDEVSEFDVKVLLDEYNNELTKKHPGMVWPIKNCVAENNFKFVSGVCLGWNKMELMTYINHTFSLVSGLLNESELNAFGIKTWLKFNNIDVHKENSKDLCKYYVELESSKQQQLEDIFVAMCMCSDISLLGTMWKNLSTILLSKYLTDKVRNALESLTLVPVEDSYCEEMVYDYQKLPEDMNSNEAFNAFQNSDFFHHFQSLTHRKTISVNVGPTNVFYCEEYSEVFLKKYLSIAPLWTGLAYTHIDSNTIGIQHLKRTAEQLNGSVGIDEFFNRIETFRKQTSSAELVGVDQEKSTEKKRHKVSRKSTFKNGLFKTAALYFVPAVQFIVSSLGKNLLSSHDYNLLQDNESLTVSLVEFVFVVFQRSTNKVQFEAVKGSSIVTNDGGEHGMLKITKETLVAPLLNGKHFTLLIINCTKRSFYIIDPKTEHPPETQMLFENFKVFLANHNKKFFRNKIPEDNWEVQSLNHQTDSDERKSGICILNFVDQYLKTGKIDRAFTPEEYRLELQQMLLQHSDNMAMKCIICDSKLSAKQKVNSSTKCETCKRWTHYDCSKDTIGSRFCLICKESGVYIDEIDNSDTEENNEVDVEC